MWAFKKMINGGEVHEVSPDAITFRMRTLSFEKLELTHILNEQLFGSLSLSGKSLERIVFLTLWQQLSSVNFKTETSAFSEGSL